MNEYDVHTIANTLKYYFQVLPNPLLTYELYPRFIAAICLEDKELRLSYYRALFATLPKPRFDLCVRLLSLFRKVSEKYQTNKMDIKNLGIVLGPLLLRSRENENEVYRNYLHYSKYLIKFGRHLISHYTSIFGHPSLPLRSIRANTACPATRACDLNIKESAVIHIFRQIDNDWYGESEGRFGTIPESFVTNAGNYTSTSIEFGITLLPITSPKVALRNSSESSYNLSNVYQSNSKVLILFFIANKCVLIINFLSLFF